MSDKLTVCLKCGGSLCYESHFETVKSYMCLGCGFQSNSLLKDGSDFQKEQESTLPELYKDLKFVDVEGKAWYPVVINYPNKGMIFADGVSKDNWYWTAILATKVSEDEKERFKKPNSNEYYEFKMDNQTKRHFEKIDFISGVGYLGIVE